MRYVTLSYFSSTFSHAILHFTTNDVAIKRILTRQHVFYGAIVVNSYVNVVLERKCSVSLQGLYDIHIQLNGVPILPWKPPPLSNTIYASEVMSYPVVAMRQTEKVERIVQILLTETHNGFPITDPPVRFITLHVGNVHLNP